MTDKKYRLLTKGYGYHPFTEQKKSDSVKELLEAVAGMGGNICDWKIVNESGRTIRKCSYSWLK